MAYTDTPTYLQDPNLFRKLRFNEQPVSTGAPVSQDSPGTTIDRMFTGAPPEQSGWADLASILGGFSSGEKADRMVKGSATGDYDRMRTGLEASRNLAGLNANTAYDNAMLNAAKGRNENETDAWRKLGQTEYVLGGGSKFKMPTITYNGQSATPTSFGLAPRTPSEVEMKGAQTLQDTIMSRFGEDGSYIPERFTPDTSYEPRSFEDYGATPGTLEKLGSYGGAIVGGIGAIDKLMGGGNEDGSGGGVLGKAGGLVGGLKKLGGLFGGGGGGMSAANLAGAPGLGATGEGIVEGSGLAGIGGNAAGSTMGNMLGKALPIAGAAYGGYQLAKGGSTRKNIASGAGTGASIGTMIAPGIGTGIGAGVGALAGALRNGFRGSKTENEGREIGAQAVQSITGSASEQQQAEAAGAGWDKPQDALAMIVMRDNLIKAGKPGNLAESYLGMIKEAEKKGPEAVQTAMQTIMQALNGGGQQQPEQFGGGNAVARPTYPGLTPGGPGTYRG